MDGETGQVEGFVLQVGGKRPIALSIAAMAYSAIDIE